LHCVQFNTTVRDHDRPDSCCILICRDLLSSTFLECNLTLMWIFSMKSIVNYWGWAQRFGKTHHMWDKCFNRCDDSVENIIPWLPCTVIVVWWKCVTLHFEPALYMSGCVHKSGQKVNFRYVFLWHVIGMLDKFKL